MDNKTRADQWEADVKWLLEQPQGRRVLWGILEKTGINALSFTGDSKTFFREGSRNVGLWLQAESIRCNRARYLTMQEENLQ